MYPALGFLFGCFIGSFLNVCIYRLPRNLSVVAPPSRCGSCGTLLAWYDNLPVIGWLMLRGHCRWCGSSFSPRYLIMELLVGGLSALVLWWGMGDAPPAAWLLQLGWSTEWAQAAGSAVMLAFVYMLFVAAVIDLDHLIIPDEITIAFQAAGPLLALACGAPAAFDQIWSPAPWLDQDRIFALGPDISGFLTMVLGLGGSAVLALIASLPVARAIYGDRGPVEQRWNERDHRAFATGVWWFAGVSVGQLFLVVALTLVPKPWAPTAATHLATAVLGSLTGWWMLYGVGLAGTLIFRRNAMGFGDVKLLAPVGALLGPVGVLYVVVVAAFIGTLIGLPQRLFKATREIPFGPSLAAGALVVLFVGSRLHRWVFGH